jgi:AraC-like DNA-binding protein
MRYREYQPHPLLAKHIQCYWVLENDRKPGEQSPQRIFPDGRMELIFHFGDAVQRRTNGNGFEPQPPATVSGQIKHFILLQPAGRLGVLGVRFHPAGTLPFLRVPMSELAEKVIALDSLWGHHGRLLADQIQSAPTHREKILSVEKYLLSRVAQWRDRDATAFAAIHEIYRANGAIKIDALMRKVKTPARQLERKFNEQVGISPKRFSRIVRFQNIFRIAAQNSASNLTELAHSAGYYDQAHFIREFREFSGLNPGEYFSQPHPLTDCFTSRD